MSGVYDWLRVLELEPGASFDDIRRAHRDMAKVWHPDRFANDQRLRAKAEEHQKAINEAFGNLEKWVKSGQTLPAAFNPTLADAEPVPHVPNGRAPAMRHPHRDTWTIPTPLGFRGGYKGVRRTKRRFRPRPWMAAVAVVVGLVLMLVAAVFL